MTNELINVRRFFESLQVPLSNIWLESCINWCRQENLPSNYTLKDLQDQIYQQWLLLDLRDVEVPTLPPSLATKKLFTLTGNYCLQMMQVVDISKPKLWQLQKIRDSNHLTKFTQKDSDIVGTGKRMLQLTLTDGVQEVEAMEYRTINSLNINLSPGIKIRIIGPTTVRRGRLMLEDRNVKVLGGEVEELAIPNAVENVLARILKLPLNPNPIRVAEDLLTVKEDTVNETTAPNGPNLIMGRSPPQANKGKSKPTIPEEERKIVEKMEVDSNMSRKSTTLRKESDLFADDIDFCTDDFDNIDRIIASTQKTVQPTESAAISLDSDDDFDGLDIDAHLNQIEKQHQVKTAESQQSVNLKIMTIAQLLSNKDSINRGVFKVKVKFKSIVEKLTIDDEYKLTVKLEDDSADMIVRLHSDVISEFTGYCPGAILSLKRDILENDKNAADKVMKALRNFKDKLIALDNIVEILIVKGEELPTVTKIF